MKDLLIKRPLYFYFIFLPFVVGGILLMVLYDKERLFFLFNRYNSPIADQTFFWITYLGSGFVFFIVCVFLLLKNIGNGILGFTVFAVSSIIPQFLKKIIFSDRVRPVKYFEGVDNIHLVDGVKHHFYHSFPSGHSATAFGLAVFLTLLVKDKRWGAIFGLSAILIAYSRVYLSQHFFEDIYAGACIGFLSAILVFLFMEKWIKQKPKLSKGLL